MSSSPVEEIKARLDLAELVGQTVQLRRSGRSLKGLCPFHSEKTPSFYVFPESGTWHCFGCGEGGDAFTFLMKRDNLEFVEALRELAARAGVTLARPSQASQPCEEHERLYQVLEASALFYQSILVQPAGRPGRDYLARRAVSEEMRQQFGLGYAPEQPIALQRYLASKGFSVEEMIEAGVVGRGDRGDTYDLLRGRVVFPIRDPDGRVIALGGRVLVDGVQPKYLNTPQSPLFDKGATLYALDLARGAIGQTRQVVIVEGYLDAIAAHQAGYRNVVATLGTAITERHLALLRRGSPEILLALDADKAGQTAAVRALEVASLAWRTEVVAVPTHRGGVRYRTGGVSHLKVVVLPDGLDPDDLFHRNPALWPALVAESLPVVDFVLRCLPSRYDLASAEGKRAAVEEAVAAIGVLADRVEQAHYLQKLSALVHVNEAVLARSLSRHLAAPRLAQRSRTEPVSAGTTSARNRSRPDTLEAYGLALVGASGLPEVIDLEPSDFQSPAYRALFREMAGEAGSLSDAASFRDRLPAELHEAWAAVESQMTLLGSLAFDRLRSEREAIALELRYRRLLAEHERVCALLEAEPGARQPELQREWLDQLQKLRSQLERVERLKLERGRVGSMVPRYRRAAEVLGGG